MLKAVKGINLQDARGEHRMPGEFRTSQYWIGVSAPTAHKLVEHFVEQGLLREITGAKRGKFYLFDPYLKLYRS